MRKRRKTTHKPHTSSSPFNFPKTKPSNSNSFVLNYTNPSSLTIKSEPRDQKLLTLLQQRKTEEAWIVYTLSITILTVTHSLQFLSATNLTLHTPPRRRLPSRRARSPPRRSPVGRRRSRSPIRRSARSRSRSFSPRRGRPPMRRGRSSSYSDSPSPRKVSRRSKSRSPRRPLKGRASSNSSSSSPPPARKP